ncbi:cold shock CspA family protein [Kibdelosporangium banguiense]|uniref:Cold shock CspA family protein n=1 Tax=Kibdelosporangium banguiense TaxID=1365924 RepID=A0ABS4TS09_9PSEU|nr:cold shock domain-containing protein [Kibdelosporangium banguiense]MBP2326735.1 cold shock CspA family protein [Kibdelosporangium banguiense]
MPEPIDVSSIADVQAAAESDRVPDKADARAEARKQGTVVRLDRAMGYGYIRPDDGGVDVYFAISDSTGELTIGQRVEFDYKPGTGNSDFGADAPGFLGRIW